MVIKGFTGFDWDDGNREKCRKHGVPLLDIEAVFHSKRVITTLDMTHSDSEERFLTIGRSEQGRYVFISFTLRRKNDQTFIRPIGARYMHQKEVRKYGQKAADIQNG